MVVMLLEWVFTSIFLILVVLALRAALGKRVSAGLRYALWAVVLVRLLVPVQLFTSPLAGTWVVSEAGTEQNGYTVPAPSANLAEPVVSLPETGVTPGAVPNFPDAPTVPDAPEPPAAPDLTKLSPWLGWIWLAGAAAVALVLLVSNLRFYWRLRRERVLLEGAGCPLRVYAAVNLPSPCLLGIVRPAIYVTPEAAADPDMLRHVLAHEYTHYRHGDHVWSLLRCAALAVHWWNPLVWVSAVLSQRDAELACDEGALKRLGNGERAGYGGTLLALVTAKPRPADLFRCATTMAGDKKSLKERITRIAQAPKRVIWAVVVAVLVTALACVCAFGQAEPEPEDGLPIVSTTGSRTELTFSLAEWARGSDLVQVKGTVEGFVLEEGAEWLPPGDWSTRGELNMTIPLEDCNRFLYVSAEWKDEGRTSVEISIEHIGSMDGSAFVTTITFTATRSKEGWTVTDMEGRLPKLSDDRSERKVTDEEALLLARIAAKLMTEAEEYYQGHGEGLDWPQTDLNRNGVPEELRVGGTGEKMVLEVWEGDSLLYSEEGYFAHAGYNALFLCTLDGEDYLLRYHPTMYQGYCTYNYQLFTLENGLETVSRENSAEFDINFGPLMHLSFEPETIAAFVDEINGLLAHSTQLINTDDNLLDTFKKEGRLVDDLWWLDTWEPVFTRDPAKSLLDNLRDFQTAMEEQWHAEEPKVFRMNEGEVKGNDAHVLLRYQDRSTQFDALWESSFQPEEAVSTRVLDLNGDGKDEIVFSLVEGEGTGCLVENLYVFDGSTLEQYDTSGLNEMILSQFESTGDEENFYLRGAGMDETIPKSEARAKNPYAPMADALWFKDYIRYTIEDGQVFCWLGCDASGGLINYTGYIKVPINMSPSGVFTCGTVTYVDGGLD